MSKIILEKVFPPGGRLQDRMIFLPGQADGHGDELPAYPLEMEDSLEDIRRIVHVLENIVRNNGVKGLVRNLAKVRIIELPARQILEIVLEEVVGGLCSFRLESGLYQPAEKLPAAARGYEDAIALLQPVVQEVEVLPHPGQPGPRRPVMRIRPICLVVELCLLLISFLLL